MIEISPSSSPPRSAARRVVAGAAVLAIVVALSGCYRLSSTTPQILSTSVGIPVTVCEGLQDLDLEVSADIYFDWGDGSPLDEGAYYWDDPITSCRSHTYAAEGFYEGEVFVSPGQEGWDQRPLRVNVSAADPGYITASGTCTCHAAATLSASDVAAYLGSPSSTPNTYTWSFGDGTVAVTNQALVRHTFPQRGSYVVTLTAVRSGYENPGFEQHNNAVAQVTSTVTVGF